MFTIDAINVRDALPKALNYILATGMKEQTRIGDALVAQEPVAIRYRFPKQHVLISKVRDANPFFHLMESMWMLAGRDDGAFLDFYIKDFSKNYGSNGTIMDAYGQRWRYGLRYNQLDEIVNQLRKEPTSRQAVLQMWGAGRDDLRAYSAKPCNLVATFRIWNGKLDMTVFNRSNDLIWGCCGANAVHFPILQEYIAGKVGIPTGSYWQISTNLHLYLVHHELLQKRITQLGMSDLSAIDTLQYGETVPLIEYPREFDEELSEIMEFLDLIHKGEYEIYDGNTSNSFLRTVVLRMALAHCLYKHGKMVDALDIVDTVAAQDWKRAGKEWLERRNVRR